MRVNLGAKEEEEVDQTDQREHHASQESQKPENQEDGGSREGKEIRDDLSEEGCQANRGDIAQRDGW